MVAWVILLGAMSVGQPAFADKVAAFEAKRAAIAAARGVEPRGAATLEWLRAAKALLESIPFEGPSRAQRAWLDAHDDLVVYHEPGGMWILQNTAVWRAHDENRQSTAADEIAWLAVENGLPGECEGYVPCYLSKLGALHGEYLARHPGGRHAADALDRMDEMLAIVLDDLLKRRDASDFLKVPDDCADVRQMTGSLRATVSRVASPKGAKVIEELDRLRAKCPARSALHAKLDRVVSEAGGEPPLDFFHAYALALRVRLELIAPDPADVEVLRFRM